MSSGGDSNGNNKDCKNNRNNRDYRSDDSSDEECDGSSAYRDIMNTLNYHDYINERQKHTVVTTFKTASKKLINNSAQTTPEIKPKVAPWIRKLERLAESIYVLVNNLLNIMPVERKDELSRPRKLERKSSPLEIKSLPAETEHAESLPAEKEHAESLPAEKEHAESLPAETEHAESLPAETEHAESLPADQKAETVQSSSEEFSQGTFVRDQIIVIKFFIEEIRKLLPILMEEEKPESPEALISDLTDLMSTTSFSDISDVKDRSNPSSSKQDPTMPDIKAASTAVETETSEEAATGDKSQSKEAGPENVPSSQADDEARRTGAIPKKLSQRKSSTKSSEQDKGARPRWK